MRDFFWPLRLGIDVFAPPSKATAISSSPHFQTPATLNSAAPTFAVRFVAFTPPGLFAPFPIPLATWFASL